MGSEESSSDFIRPVWLEDRTFSGELEEVLSQSYLSALLREVQVDKESALWLKSLFLSAKVARMQDSLGKQEGKKTKIIYSRIKENRRLRRRSRNKQLIARSIREDN